MLEGGLDEACSRTSGLQSVGPLTAQIGKAADGPTFPANSFDRIMLDAPCSALGLRPRLRCDLTHEFVLRQSNYQKRLIINAAALLKKGGRLVYSTCSVSPEENEKNVAFALERLPLVLCRPPVQCTRGGLKSQGLSDDHCELVERFEPFDELDSIGFFYAVFEKISDGFERVFVDDDIDDKDDSESEM